MDLIHTPFLLDANPPQERFDSDRLRHNLHLWLERLHTGRPAKTLVLIGLSGAGKIQPRDPLLRIEIAKERPMPAILAAILRSALSRLNRFVTTVDYAIQQMRASTGFAPAPMRETKTNSSRPIRNFEPRFCETASPNTVFLEIGEAMRTAVGTATCPDDVPAALSNSILLRQWVTAF